MAVSVAASLGIKREKGRKQPEDDEEEQDEDMSRLDEFEVELEGEEEKSIRKGTSLVIRNPLQRMRRHGSLVPTHKDVVSNYIRPFNTPSVDARLVKKYLRDEGIPASILLEGSTALDSTKCLISPNGKLRSRWDILVLLALAFTALVTPVETAFFEPADTLAEAVDLLFVINRIVDSIFIVDIFLNFATPVYSNSQARMVWTHTEIALEYARFWLWIDVVSIIPFDIIAYVSEDEELGKLAGLSVLRLLRLAKLLRLFRASRILRRWESAISISHNRVQLSKFAFTIILLAHWMACGFKLVQVLEATTPNWITKYFADDFATNTTIIPWESQYVAALYWAVMTITTIGYGDVNPATDPERWYAVLAMLFGGSVYAYIIGSVCGIVASMDEIETHFHQRIDHLNRYLRENEVPNAMRWKIREFFYDSKNAQKRQGTTHLLQDLSPDMRKQLALHVKAGAVNAVPYIAYAPMAEKRVFLTALALELKEKVFPSLEAIGQPSEQSKSLMVISKGAVLLNRSFFISPKLNPMRPKEAPEGANVHIERILSSISREVLGVGCNFGEEMILNNAPRRYHVVALSYVELHELTRNGLDRIRVKYREQLPETIHNLRWYAIKLAFQKNAIHAIYKTRREIDERGLLDNRIGSTVEEKEETFDALDYRLDEGGTPSLEAITRKMNRVLEALNKSSRKVERLEMQQRERALELEDRANAPKYTYLHALKPPTRFKRN